MTKTTVILTTLCLLGTTFLACHSGEGGAGVIDLPDPTEPRDHGDRDDDRDCERPGCPGTYPDGDAEGDPGSSDERTDEDEDVEDDEYLDGEDDDDE